MWLQATDDWGQTTTATLTLQTPARTNQPQAQADGDTIMLDGQPFFPRMLWATCVHDVQARIEIGINLFMGNGCGDDKRLLEALDGRAVAAMASTSGHATGPGLIGWYYPDEWDEHLPSKMSFDDLRRLVARPPQGLLSFLTLTNHFYSRAEPLPQGRGIYGALTQIPDVLGFDIYPMQVWCRDDRFTDIFDAQRELDQLTATKPSFQWIEVRAMQCEGDHLRPQPATVRAETWLAVAGGADGIGYFPSDWTPEVESAINRTNGELGELAPALLGGLAGAASESPSLRVGARELNGALYVIAVNASRNGLDATIHVPGLGSRTLDVFGEARTLVAVGDALSDHFDPLAVHIYVAAPDGWSRTAGVAAFVKTDMIMQPEESSPNAIDGLPGESDVPGGLPFMR